jgi:hypothetical protein
MSEEQSDYEKLIEQIYFTEQFGKFVAEFADSTEEPIWFTLSKEESQRYLTTLLERIQVEEKELEKLFQTPEAERIYRRVRKRMDRADIGDSIESIRPEVQMAIRITEKLRWVGQKEIAQEISGLLESGVISSIAIGFDNEMVPML